MFDWRFVAVGAAMVAAGLAEAVFVWTAARRRKRREAEMPVTIAVQEWKRFKAAGERAQRRVDGF